MTIPYQDLAGRLQERIRAVLDPYFADGQPFAIVDFPNIRNVGDSAIWLGEMAYLRAAKRRPAYVSEIANHSSQHLREEMPKGPIFIHGGGNFGDVWESHQRFRERILEEFPDRQVIQFPQSIHFDSPARIEQSARIIAKHGNFVLLVRDVESLEFSRKHFECEVILCPDMALCIGPIAPLAAARLPILAMLREDKEKSTAYDTALYPELSVEDWITEPALGMKLVKLRSKLASLLTGRDEQAARFAKFNDLAEARFRRGIRQISRGRAIVTDRLHVHILSLLLGRPHATLDNSYGKITRFQAAFTGDSDLTYRATSFNDAMRWASTDGQTISKRLSR